MPCQAGGLVKFVLTVFISCLQYFKNISASQSKSCFSRNNSLAKQKNMQGLLSAIIILIIIYLFLPFTGRVVGPVVWRWGCPGGRWRWVLPWARAGWPPEGRVAPRCRRGQATSIPRLGLWEVNFIWISCFKSYILKVILNFLLNAV